MRHGGLLRRRSKWQQEGTAPDYRFTLANERTFLAWIRTALALVAAGIGVFALLPAFGPQGTRTALSVLLLVFGTVVAAKSFGRWARTERALRLGTPLPPTSMTRLVSTGVAILGVALLILVVGISLS